MNTRSSTVHAVSIFVTPVIVLLLLVPPPLSASSSPHPVELADPLEFGRGARPDIYVRDDGTMHVAWMNGNSLHYRYFNGSAWESPETIPVGGVGVSGKSPPSVWADSNGDPHIVWGSDGGSVYYTNRTGGDWSDAQIIVINSHPKQYSYRDTQIAVGSDGTRHVVWRKKVKSSGMGTIWYKNWRNGSWGSATKISEGSGTAKRPQIALDAGDELHVVWRQRGGPGNSYEVMYRKWANGSWGGVEFATYTTPRAGEDPHVALDSAQKPHVSFPEGSSVAYIEKTGMDWTDPTLLGEGDDPVIAIDDSNTVYIIWEDKYRYNKGSGWEPVQVYDEEASTPDAYGGGRYAHVVYRKEKRVWYIPLSAGGDPPQQEEWITLTSPDGGEVWEPDSSYSITWDSSSGIDSVRIFLSTDSGSTWSVIADSAVNSGSWLWIVPDTPSEDCLVKVEDLFDDKVSDISDDDFTIGTGGGEEEEWVTVTSPNGGEVWEPGSTQMITWESSGNFPYVQIHYSTNGGRKWRKISSRTGNDGERRWTVPETLSDRCRVRVRSKEDSDIYDMSNADFTIGSGGGEEEWVTVTSPNGGEVWEPDSSYTITWDSSPGVDTVKISYSTDGGSTWITVADSVRMTNSYDWIIPDSPSHDCRVRVEDLVDNAVFDISNEDFTIGTDSGEGEDWLTVTSPNGGEIWEPGSTQMITWESSGTFSRVRIDYSTDGGEDWIKITSRTANDGAREWTIPYTISDRCVVRIRDKEDEDIRDVSDSSFTIGTAGSSPDLILSGAGVPAEFKLLQNYPNPFNPSTQIRFDVPEDTNTATVVVITVYDSRGRLVRKLLNEPLPPGSYEIHWDGRGDTGTKLRSGVYLLRVRAGSDTATMKMLLTR